MKQRLRIAVVQGNPVTGDPAGNVDALLEARRQARTADLLVTGRLAIPGGPLGGLAENRAFRRRVDEALPRLAAATADGGPALLTGTLQEGRERLLLLDGGKVLAVAPGPGVVDCRGVRIAAVAEEDAAGTRPGGALRAADLAVVLGARPFVVGAGEALERHLQALARAVRRPLLYVNRAGAADDLVFAGESMALAADGTLKARFPAFAGHAAILPFDVKSGFHGPAVPPRGGEAERVYQALCSGLDDYVRKNRFPGVLLGLSGGIDSALVAALAVDALGAARVWCVLLPSRFTSAASMADAAAVARALRVRFDTIPVTPGVDVLETMLAPQFAGRASDLAEENLQARLRMVVLMGLSNKFGHLLLSTGNKSEVAVGYGTLYGDMAGGFNPLKDIYKTMVFRLARWRNANHPAFCRGPKGEVIPESVLTKAPSAELRAGQRDDDSLPPYEVLDPILHALVEERRTAGEIIAAGLGDAETVQRVEQLLFAAEHKRRQACPGPSVSGTSFARDWRYPLTNPFRSGA